MPQSTHPREAFIRMKLGEVRELKDANRLEEAGALLEELRRDVGEEEGVVFSFAGLHLRMKRPERAVELLKRNRESLHGHGIYHRMLAEALRRCRLPEEALEEALLSRDQQNLEQVKLMVRILMDMERHEEAYERAKRALAAYPDDPELLRARSTVAQKTGRTEEALEVMEALHRKFPKDSFVYQALIRLRLERKEGDGVEDLDRLIKVKRSREKMELISLKGQKLYKSRKYPDAVVCFQDLLAEDPENRYFRRMLGFSLSKAGREKEAAEHLGPLFLEDPNDVYVRTALEKILKNSGDRARMLELGQQALERHPGCRFCWKWIREGEKVDG